MKNKYLFLIIGVLFVASTAFYFVNRKPSMSKTVTLENDAVVTMGSDSYAPQNFKVNKGTKITFLNSSDGLRWPASDLHPSHLIYPEFDSKEPVKQGESWSVEFDKVGEWGYHDHLAPYITGTINVVE